jgi:hypothetical protein
VLEQGKPLFEARYSSNDFLAVSILLSRRYLALREAPKVYDAFFFRHPIVGRTNNGLLDQ